jgi:hypothetical protein
MGGLACVFDPALKGFLSIMKEPPNFEATGNMLNA